MTQLALSPLAPPSTVGSWRRCVHMLTILGLTTCAIAFSPPIASSTRSHSETITSLFGYNSVYGNRGKTTRVDRSKRQERVGQLVQSEVSRIIHTGLIKGNDAEILDAELRQRISVVNTDVSPDLRQARISVSIRRQASEESNPAVDRRRAYAWLVRNTKSIRHTLAQRMSHMKNCPNLSFVQVDVAAAVDVMYLIDKVSQGDFKRGNVDLFDPDDVASGAVGGMQFDDDLDDDDGWDEDDGDFFSSSK